MEQMDQNEQNKIELRMLATNLPREEGEVEHLGMVNSAFFKIKRFASMNPKAFFKYITACTILFVVCGSVIGTSFIRAYASGDNRHFAGSLKEDTVQVGAGKGGVGSLESGQSESEGVEDALEGFEAAKVKTSEEMPLDESATPDKAYENDSARGLPEGADKDTFYLSPLVSNAGSYDTICQIGDVVITFPSKISDFEKNGLELVTIGSLPPAEGEQLPPKQRDGYISYQGKSLYVRLSNGYACDYHDLTVIGIMCDDADIPFYAAGGYCIGDSESTLPQDTTSLAIDKLTECTVYSYGTLSGSAIVGNYSGKRVEYTTFEGTINKINIFDDGTVE